MLKVDQDRAFGRIKWNFIKFVSWSQLAVNNPGFVCDHQWPIFGNVPKF